MIALELLNISAPITGELLQINIRPGEFVSSQPGQSLVALGNIRDLHVRVDIDEHDVPRFRPDLPATAYVSGRPSFPYELDFVRLEPYMVPKRTLTGENTERTDTRVLRIIYKLRKRPDPEHRVYVGQQMDVFIGGSGNDVSASSVPTTGNAVGGGLAPLAAR